MGSCIFKWVLPFFSSNDSVGVVSFHDFFSLSCFIGRVVGGIFFY